jgi:hypothetical protein
VRRALLLAALALLVGGCGADDAAGTAEGRPRLSIDGTAPVRISGTGFKPRERVKLLITAGRPLVQTAVATPAGRFQLRLSVTLNRCDSIVVQALGSRGSRAMTDLTSPDCAPIDQS